jgi:hypothetical protein
LAELESFPYCTGKIIAFSSGEQRQSYFRYNTEPDSRLICPSKRTILSLNKAI